MKLGDLHISDRDGIVTAALTGEIDMSNAGELASEISRAAANEMFGVVLDLTDVSYLDSAGIHLLYRLRASLRSRGQKLVVVIPGRSPVRDALRLAGVEDQIAVVEDPQHAAETLRPSAP